MITRSHEPLASPASRPASRGLDRPTRSAGFSAGWIGDFPGGGWLAAGWRRRFGSLRYWLALAALLLVPSSQAQPLRVTTWNLQPPFARTNASAANTNGIRIPSVAAALKKLNPDVILLQQVTDWAMCDELAAALKPATYKVVVCSAFRDGRSGALRKQQVAILARPRAKAYFSWSEPWTNRAVPALSGGCAFAAFQIGKERVGFFSVQVGSASAGATNRQQIAVSPEKRLAATVEQLLAQVKSVGNWVTNRVQTFVVGGTFGLSAGQQTALQGAPLELLQEAGFGDVFEDAPAAERATLRGKAGQPGPVGDYLFAQPANCATNPAVARMSVARHYPVTCEVNLGTPATASAQTARVERAPARKPQSAASQTAQAKAPSMPSAAAPIQSPERRLQPAAAALPPPSIPRNSAVESESTLRPQLVWLAAAVAGMVALVFTVWAVVRRRRTSPPTPSPLLTADGDAPSGYTVVLTSRSTTESASPNRRSLSTSRPLIHMEAPETTHTQTELLRQRALAAEQRAEHAHAVIRARLIPHLGHWLKQHFVRKLIADRKQMLETQQAAALKATDVEQRLARIERQIQRQNHSYQQRIEELTRELLVAKDENRELIRARIVQVKAQMADARARLLAQSQTDRDIGT